MKRTIAVLLAASLLAALCSCGDRAGEEDDGVLRVAATTYPVYLFTTALTDGVEGVEVELMIDQQISCLHDYTLTIRDMKILDRADLVVMNGAGLEEFLSPVLAQIDAPAVDCSAGVELLPALGHEGHDHEAEDDPHFWMCRAGAQTMLENIAAGLSEADPDHGALYARRCREAVERLPDGAAVGEAVSCPYLVTFHDGAQYLARDCGLTILAAIEEEEGAEASAAELREVLELVREHELPAIFVEANGSDRAARAIARETGCGVYELDMIMSGEGTGLEGYLEAIRADYAVLLDALGGE